MTGRVMSSERERREKEVRVEREERERERGGKEERKREREVGKRPSQRELRAQTTTDTFLSRPRREKLLV